VTGTVPVVQQHYLHGLTGEDTSQKEVHIKMIFLRSLPGPYISCVPLIVKKDAMVFSWVLSVSRTNAGINEVTGVKVEPVLW